MLLWKQQLRRLGVMQERSVAPGGSGGSVQERCRNVLSLRKQNLSDPEALQERSVAV